MFENTNTGYKYILGTASPYTFSSIPYLSLFLSKIQKNNFHKSNNSCQSVSKFQLVKASSKLIQPLFYLTTGLLMELIWITGIPNTAVTMEIFLLQCISPTVQKHPLRHHKIKPAQSCCLKKTTSTHCSVYQPGTAVLATSVLVLWCCSEIGWPHSLHQSPQIHLLAHCDL